MMQWAAFTNAMLVIVLSACGSACGGTSGSAASPPPPTPSARAACVEDALADARRRVQAQSDPTDETALQLGEPMSATGQMEAFDLDGDGQVEQVFTSEIGTATAVHFIYLTNNGCLTFGGEVAASAYHLEALPESHNGVRMLQTFASDGCAGNAGSVQRWRWTTSQWESVERIACECPDDAPTRPRNPACP